MRARHFSTLVLLLGLVVAAPARGEVAAKLDARGRYVCMVYRYVPGAGGGRIWSVVGATSGRRPLNQFGDLRGDLAPAVLENTGRSNYPVAVWSRPSSGSYDLVYSEWNGTAWNPTRFVHPHTAGNDLEPALAFNSAGNGFLVWWTNHGGAATVYFSMLAGGRWTEPLRVSPVREDARHPTVTPVSDTLIRVSYATLHGIVTRDVVLSRSESITDDIDPKYQVEIQAER